MFLSLAAVLTALNASLSNSGLFCSCSRDYPGLLQITFTRSPRFGAEMRVGGCLINHGEVVSNVVIEVILH